LSRSRFTAHSTQSLRFYREYFKPTREVVIHKERRRCHILYKDTEFAVNIDRLTQPKIDGAYLEVKSRTWSLRDADHKARLIGELLGVFEIDAKGVTLQEYIDIAA
jgi:5-methylthioadenosine/S-adenosylhomocysteine deaminase